MIVREPWWVFPNLLSDADCDRVIEHGLALTAEDGKLRASDEAELRRTRVAWIREDWVYDLVEPFVYKANDSAGWNFDVERMQSLQFGSYPVGGHYGWHFDMTGRTYSEKDNVAPVFHGLLRKVSFSVQLCDPATFDGGHLEIEWGLPNAKNRVESPDPARTRGTLVVFPSFLPHRVTPVTRGERHSLVGWVCGKPWR